MAGWVSQNFSVPETPQIRKIPPEIERSRPQDLKSAIKNYKKDMYVYY